MAGPQVFINFRGEGMRNGFVTFVETSFREANINVFVDNDQVVGTELANLLVKIRESRVAVVIFSKDYTSSQWCLDELATIKDCTDQGSLSAFPIFYKLEPLVVEELRGDFGDSFRALKRAYRHEPDRTQKWEEALEFIPKLKGLSLSEKESQKLFIKSMVWEIQRLLSQIAGTPHPSIESNPQGGFLVPARNLEREVIRQGGSTVPSMVPARQLEITHSENSQKWAWSFINEAPNNTAVEVEVAKMIKIHWLKIVGTYDTTDLIPGTKYEAVFLVKLEDDAIGWEQPVTLKLKVEQHDGSDNRVDRTENLKEYIGRNWVDILAGVFVVPPRNTPAKITFTMYHHETKDKKKGLVDVVIEGNNKKTGLVVKGVAIRPTH